jgi:hypothetical protein
MDGSRFDSWTRRRIGLAASGLAVALAGLFPVDAKKKKKRKKKQCKKLGATCSPTGRKCCKGNACESVCCKQSGKSCASSDECCTLAVCFEGTCQIET